MNKQRTHERLERQRTNEDAIIQQSAYQVPENVYEVPGSNGQSLASETRTFMEPRFGHDFGQVRIHADERTGTEHAQPVARLTDAAPTEAVIGPEGGPLSPNLSASIQAERGSGTSLNAPVREQMEQSFGANFADVRLHTDPASHAFNHSVGARAFTVGSDIFFGPKASPGETPLLAHELTHVVQQRGMDNGGPIVVGPAGDSSEQEASMMSTVIASNVPPAVGSVAGEANQVQRVSEDAPLSATHTTTEGFSRLGTGLLIQRAEPTMEERFAAVEKREKAMEQRVAAMQQAQDVDRQATEKHEKARDIHQKATDLDQLWRAKFEKQFAGYREAIERISGGLQAATKGFEEAQKEQAETEATVMSVVKAMVVFAGGFEFAFAEHLGKLAGVTEKTAEHILSVGHAATDIVVDAVKEGIKPAKTPESASIPGAKTLAGAAGGDPLAFLTSNLAALDNYQQTISNAFIQRSMITGSYTSDDQWSNFSPPTQEAIYKDLFDKLDKVASTADKLKPDSVIAHVLERHIWAHWIVETAERVDNNTKEMVGGIGGMPFEGTEGTNSIFTPGADIEKRLNEVFVAAFAGVELTGHWYSSNSPDNWRDLLIKWARKYDEGIGFGS